MLTAADAAAIGLVNRVVPAGELLAVAADLAHRIAALPPIQIQTMKRQLNQSLSVSMGDALEFEDVAQAANFGSRDTAEALTAFLERRDPQFTGE